MRSRPGHHAGFSLLEVVCAFAIAATALVAMQATIGQGIIVAGDSINRRAAREIARAKMEEILAGVESAEGGGTIEDRPNFKWSAKTDELTVGMPETGTQIVRIVTLEFTFPVESATGEGAEAGEETITLASVMPPEDPPQ